MNCLFLSLFINSILHEPPVTSVVGFTMPPKNKKARQEVTGDPSQDTPKQAKKLNGEMLHTFLALYASVNLKQLKMWSGLSKDSWTKIREEYNAKFYLTREPKYFRNV
ncbi:hypothetical protein GIB67_015586 [Kingdonia uniflora]|uniref:Uncharacterized protein n=1 Tax=Kingdonia uniflora TaxID=39325 RepID=A0A7J7LUB7_9MAGN|nr:hypothetical protein GIB67_015586 [Kingdonia uniflora]